MAEREAPPTLSVLLTLPGFIFCGDANNYLAQKITDYLPEKLGVLTGNEKTPAYRKFPISHIAILGESFATLREAKQQGANITLILPYIPSTQTPSAEGENIQRAYILGNNAHIITIGLSTEITAGFMHLSNISGTDVLLPTLTKELEKRNAHPTNSLILEYIQFPKHAQLAQDLATACNIPITLLLPNLTHKDIPLTADSIERKTLILPLRTIHAYNGQEILKICQQLKQLGAHTIILTAVHTDSPDTIKLLAENSMIDSIICTNTFVKELPYQKVTVVDVVEVIAQELASVHLGNVAGRRSIL